MFFERPDSGELAVLVHIDFSHLDQEEDAREFEELVLSAGGDPVDFILGKRNTPHPRFFVGTGKLDELKAAVQGHGAEIVIFNHELSPSQERNLEKELNCRVLDRTGLILDIFAQRARTHEGKLQVELAQLNHMSTRLIRGWTHLERQKGGIGLRGPGETQLETDRRLLRERIKSINKRLEKVRKQRDQGRRSRTRSDISTVSLVGYTNAGKSTLFNAITEAGVYAQDQLFATLDPTMRRIELNDTGLAILADTVGFISNLPHRLVEAFRATLEEAANADLLLHVIDAACEDRDRNIEQVNEVLKEIGAGDIPCIHIYNKIDLLENMKARVDLNENAEPISVWVSAQEKLGLDLLLEAADTRLRAEMFDGELCLTPAMSKLRAALYRTNSVKNEEYDSVGNSILSIRIAEKDLARYLSMSELKLHEVCSDA